MVRKEYICPRCNTKSVYKGDMNKHFKRQKPCYNYNNLELTDEIKKIVLRDHIYHPPQQNEQAKVVNNINHYNILNNFIQTIDTDRKLNLLMDADDGYYGCRKRLSFEDTLDRDFEYRNDKMERDAYPLPYMLDESRLLDVIDSATKIDERSITKLNVLFDKAVNKIKVWMGSEWESHAEEKGVIQIVSYIKSYFLNNYELYLIRKLHKEGQNGFNPFTITEHLKIYYKFLIPFRLKPCVLDYEDKQILGHRLSETNPRLLADRYMAVYCEQEKEIKTTERNRLKRDIAKIIKGNSVHNISMLNNAIFELIKIDEGFKAHVMGDIGLDVI